MSRYPRHGSIRSPIIGKRRRVMFFAMAIMLIGGFGSLTAQEELNPNRYYAYPAGLFVDYMMYTPFMFPPDMFTVFEISGGVKIPIPGAPVLQPFVKGGIIRFDYQNADTSKAKLWDHIHAYGGLGLGFSYRFSKTFEIGADLMGAYSYAIYSNIETPENPEEVAPRYGYHNILARVGLNVGLDPSYALSIQFNPNVTYMYSFAPESMWLYDGLFFCVGFGISFRFGQDPDVTGGAIRSINFVDVEVSDSFAAMQSYYVDHPIGTVTIENSDEDEIEDVVVSFYQAGFMDSPTPATKIQTLEAGETLSVDLFASFNDEVFSTEGITPLTGEVQVSYSSKGRGATQSQAVTYDLYDKTSLTWDDDRKVGAFITPADSALRNYSSFVRQTTKEDVLAAVPKNLQTAMQVYHGLSELGMLYQIDPTSPFTEAQGNPIVVDSISLPRTTLQRRTGDCDDLTALYCSLLETVGIKSAFMTVPGHIYAAFDSGVAAKDYDELHPVREMALSVNGNLWVPVEITMIGRGTFMEAWQTGVQEWLGENDEKNRGFYLTAEAQKEFRPVGLRETDLGLQYAQTAEPLSRVFDEELARYADVMLAPLIAEAERSGGFRDYNILGVTAAKLTRYTTAESAFRSALESRPDSLSVRVNLGSLLYLQDRHADAIEAFIGALDAVDQSQRAGDSFKAKVCLNIAKAYYELEDFTQAKSYYDRAAGYDETTVTRHEYLAAASSGEGRATEAQESQILFIEEDL